MQAALAAGATGYAAKGDDVDLAPAVRLVLGGAQYLGPLPSRCLQAVASPTGPALTEQERAIYGLLGQGHAPVRIAARLHISVKTVLQPLRSVEGQVRRRQGAGVAGARRAGARAITGQPAGQW